MQSICLSLSSICQDSRFHFMLTFTHSNWVGEPISLGLFTCFKFCFSVFFFSGYRFFSLYWQPNSTREWMEIEFDLVSWIHNVIPRRAFSFFFSWHNFKSQHKFSSELKLPGIGCDSESCLFSIQKTDTCLSSTVFFSNSSCILSPATMTLH